ncbi:MAG: M20/M25/M40 family metallo-hydrolase [Oscillospiraceae bacterium]|nr:M20/M25/M40 family metallo-hydrolase [Oscillospiraceae bacterium]
MEAIFERLKALTALRCVSGNEGELAELIRTQAAPFADEVRTDAMGNVLIRKGTGGKRLLFAAHMDTAGLMATHIDEKGFVRFGTVGSIQAVSILHAPVIFSNGTCGVVGKEDGVEEKDLKIKHLYIDIGARDRAEAETLILPGDTAVFKATASCVGTRVLSPALDDRAGCLVLLTALERLQSPANEVWFTFTVQKEVGLRGAKTAAYGICPDYGFSVDVVPAGDMPGQKEMSPVRLGGGAALRIMDSSLIAHPAVVSLLEELARAKNIPTQRAVLTSGTTDAGAIRRTHFGVPTGSISVPARYVHTPCEMVDMRDLSACVELVTAVAEATL